MDDLSAVYVVVLTVELVDPFAAICGMCICDVGELTDAIGLLMATPSNTEVAGTRDRGTTDGLLRDEDWYVNAERYPLWKLAEGAFGSSAFHLWIVCRGCSASPATAPKQTEVKIFKTDNNS